MDGWICGRFEIIFWPGKIKMPEKKFFPAFFLLIINNILLYCVCLWRSYTLRQLLHFKLCYSIWAHSGVQCCVYEVLRYFRIDSVGARTRRIPCITSAYSFSYVSISNVCLCVCLCVCSARSRKYCLLFLIRNRQKQLPSIYAMCELCYHVLFISRAWYATISHYTFTSRQINKR